MSADMVISLITRSTRWRNLKLAVRTMLHVLNFLCRVTALRLSRTASARPDILVPVLHARFVPRAISAMVMEPAACQ